MARPGLVGVLVTAVAAWGCAGARSAEASRTAPRPEDPRAAAAQPGDPGASGPARHHAAMRCPMDVPGTQVSASDTPEGVSITFTTSEPDQVPDLRARIHAMADRYERRHARAEQESAPDGAGESGAGSRGSADGGSPDAQAPARPAAPSRAVVEDIEGGARIDVTPNDPSELDSLRTAIRDRVDRMQETRSCAPPAPARE